MPQSRTGRPIIIDTDPGQNDAIALLLALASPAIDVLGIIAVAGNVPLSLTAKHALKVCDLPGRPSPKHLFDRPPTPSLLPTTAGTAAHNTRPTRPSLPTHP